MCLNQLKVCPYNNLLEFNETVWNTEIFFGEVRQNNNG